MAQNRIPIIQRVSQSVRQKTPVDIYAVVDDLKCDFPSMPEDDLARIVTEEVISAGATAFWGKRER